MANFTGKHGRRNSFLATLTARNSSVATTGFDHSVPARVSLSDAQRRLWFLYHLNPQASCAYDISFAYRLNGSLHLDALTEALNALIERHDALRTILEVEDGEPFQKTAPESTIFPLQFEDLSGAPAGEREAHLQERLEQHKAQPFDLIEHLLVRCVVIRTSESEHILFIKKSHLVSDGWSVDVFLAELAELYRASLEQRPPQLPKMGASFAAHVSRELDWHASADCAAQIDQWVAELDGSGSDLGIPGLAVEAAAQAFAGDRFEFLFEGDAGDKVRALASRLGTTPFAVLFGAWALVLARYGGMRDLTIGVPVANRPGTDVRSTVGFFVNTLALRVRTSPDLRVCDYISQIGDSVARGLDRQRAPLSQIVNRLGRGNGSSGALFRTMFALDMRTKDIDLHGVRSSRVDLRHPFSDHDISLDLTLAGTGPEAQFYGAITYSTDLYDKDFVSRMSECLLQMVDEMVGAPNKMVGDLAMLPARQKSELLSFNPEAIPLGEQSSALDAFDQHVRISPDRLALDSPSGVLTYSELNNRAEQLADCLATIGVARGDRIVLHLSRDASMIVAIFATLKLGAIYIPLDRMYPVDRKQLIVEDAAPACIVYDSQNGLPVSGARQLLIEADGRVPCSRSHPRDTRVGANARDIAYRIYTSGTTGRPKGVDITHRNLMTLIAAMTKATDLSPADRVLQFSSFSFDQSVEDIFTTLSAGATLVIRPETMRVPDRDFRAFLEDKAISYMSLPTGFWHHWTQEIANGNAIPKAPLRLVAVGGEKALPRSAAIWFDCEQLAGCPILNTYGPTEATVTAMVYSIGEKDARGEGAVPIGSALAGFRTYVVDQDGRLAPYGAIGELWIGGTAVGAGYANLYAQTRAAFGPDPFADGDDARVYRTGDMVRWIAPGTLGFVGRRDDQVKFRGFRVELPEIESALALYPSVLQAVALVTSGGEEVDRLVAYVVLDQSKATTDRIALKKHVSRLLPEFMVPDTIVFLERLPLSANGKVDRNALKALDLPATSPRPRPTGLLSESETIIARIWQSLMNCEQIGRSDDFFRLGGHSLLAMRFIARLRKETGKDLTLAEMIGAPTVGELGERLDAVRAHSPDQQAFRVTGNRPGRPIFAIHAIDGEIGYVHRLASSMPDDRPIYAIAAMGLLPGETPREDIKDFVDAYLTAVRLIQPEGPYSLLGWSAGGTIAWAMAERLRQDGREVDFLGLIDSRPSYPDPESSDDPMERLEERHHGFETIASLIRNRPGSEKLLQDALDLPPGSALTLMRRGQEEGLIPHDISWETVQQFQRIRDGIFRAVRQVKPKSGDVDGDSAFLFTADPGCRPADLGWHSICPAITVMEIGGNHYSIVDSPFVSKLGKSLTFALRLRSSHLVPAHGASFTAIGAR